MKKSAKISFQYLINQLSVTMVENLRKNPTMLSFLESVLYCPKTAVRLNQVLANLSIQRENMDFYIQLFEVVHLREQANQSHPTYRIMDRVKLFKDLLGFLNKHPKNKIGIDLKELFNYFVSLESLNKKEIDTFDTAFDSEKCHLAMQFTLKRLEENLIKNIKDSSLIRNGILRFDRLTFNEFFSDWVIAQLYEKNSSTIKNHIDHLSSLRSPNTYSRNRLVDMEDLRVKLVHVDKSLTFESCGYLPPKGLFPNLPITYSDYDRLFSDHYQLFLDLTETYIRSSDIKDFSNVFNQFETIANFIDKETNLSDFSLLLEKQSKIFKDFTNSYLAYTGNKIKLDVETLFRTIKSYKRLVELTNEIPLLFSDLFALKLRAISINRNEMVKRTINLISNADKKRRDVILKEVKELDIQKNEISPQAYRLIMSIYEELKREFIEEHEVFAKLFYVNNYQNLYQMINKTT